MSIANAVAHRPWRMLAKVFCLPFTVSNFMPHTCRWLPLLLIMLSLRQAAAQSALHLPESTLPEAKLVTINDTGQLVFEANAPVQPHAPHEIVRWSSPRPVAAGSAVALLDGSWLSGQLQWTDEQTVKVNSKWFEPVELKVNNLRAVLLNASPSWFETQQNQDRMLSPTGSQDVVWKRGAESIAGIVSLNIKPGLVSGDAQRLNLSFKTPSATVATELSPNDIEGITFSPVLRRPITERRGQLIVTLRDGCRLIVRQFKPTEDGRVQLVLAAGQTLVTLDEANTFVEAVTSLAGQPAGVTWLSELEPARYRLLESTSQVPWPLGRDRDLFGKSLPDEHGNLIEHALVVHAPAQVAYRADAKSQRLLAELSLLPPSPSGSPGPAFGSARCEVLVARNNQLTSVWKSEILRPGQPPVPVDADVSNAQLIVLLVDQADQGPLGDQVLWRDARLSEK